MAEREQYERNAYLDQLSTEELEEILRLDAMKPGQENEEAIFHILEVLEKREQENPTRGIPDVEQAWKEFQTYYNIPEGEGQSLYPMGDTEYAKELPEETEKVIRFRPKKSLIVALIAVLLFGSMITVQVSGIDVFGAIGRWTEETFQFSIPTEAAKNTENMDQVFYDAAEEVGIPEQFLPLGYLKGYEPMEPERHCVEDYMESVSCEYYNEKEDNGYLVMVAHYHDPSDLEATIYEKDDGEVVTYQSNGRMFYIFSNVNTFTATWSDGSFEITIIGDVELEQMEKIIDLIGE